MKVKIKSFKELNLELLYDLIALRISVFVVEQNCPYQELDDLDKEAFHLLMFQENQLVGAARILKNGIVYQEVAIGRVATHPDFRGQQLGHTIMKEAITFIAEKLRETAIRLSAQTHLTSFYEKHGFKSTGKTYLEDGIPHTEMLRTI
ncbi:MAG: GNAT family N-acetyltransferase [Crocinitomicaceae bacterium]